MIGILTDSNSMLPEALVARLGVSLVPMIITVDDRSMTEDHSIDLDDFYRRLRDGATITTAAPSPGAIAEAYRNLINGGATEIVSVHVGAAYSATVDAARLAARDVDVPVHVVDSGTASFGLGCCVWAAAEARTGHGDATDVSTAAKAAPTGIISVFTVGEPARARAGGRIDVETPAVGVPVIAIRGTEVDDVGVTIDTGEAVSQMTDYLAGRVRGRVRIGVGDTGNTEAADALAGALTDALGSAATLDELVRYRVGPTIAAHTGAGTFGAVAWVLDR